MYVFLCKVTNTKQNLHLSWSFLLPYITCDQAFFAFFLRGGLDPVATQSNHLLGNPRYTLTERLLANLTHLRFVFGFCLARKNGLESVWCSETFHLNTRYRANFKDFAAWPFSPVPGCVWVTLRCAKSHAHNAHGPLYVWKIIMGYPRNSRSGGWWMADFKKIFRV